MRGANRGRPVTMHALALLVITLGIAGTFAVDDKSLQAQFRKPVKCKDRQDGNYVYGCSRFYSMCSNGYEHPHSCAGGLVLNPENDQCNELKHTPICKNPGDTQLYKSKEQFKCDDAEDGSYEAGPCSGFYFQCNGGHRLEMPCPGGLVFHAGKRVCDYMVECKKELKSRPPLAPSLVVPEDPSALVPPPPQQSRQPLPSPSNNGPPAPSPQQQRPNNGPPQQQGQQLAQPNVGQLLLNQTARNPRRGGRYQQQDESESVYPPIDEVETDTEVTDSFIVEDNSPPKLSSYGTPPSQPSYGSTQQQPIYGSNAQIPKYNQPSTPSYDSNGAPSLPSTNPVTVTENFNCKDKVDGVYLTDSQACVTHFVKCSNGRSFPYDCPAGTVYNADNGQCDYRHFVTACGGRPQAPTTPSPYVTDNVPPQPPQFDCSGKKDGYYSEKPCTPIYFACVGGMATQQINCPGRLVFDVEMGSCDYAESCGKPKPTLPPQVTNNSPYDHGSANGYYFGGQKTKQQSFNPVPKPPVLSNPPSVVEPPKHSVHNFTCKNNKDGYYYKTACTPDFIICSAGQLSVQSCQDGLAFDPIVATCEYSDVCGSKRPKLVPTLPVPTQPPPNFSCRNMANGYYVENSCTSLYYACANGHVFPYSCPVTLVFDSQVSRCVYPNECGRSQKPTSPSVPAPPPYYRSQGYASQPQYGQPSQSVALKPAASAFNCGQNPDGYYYIKPCATSYFHCSGGQSTEIKCPSGLLFDATIGACDYAETCGKPKPPPTPAPVQPSTNAQPPKSNFDCNSRTDGYYFIKPCTSSYFHCLGGQSVEIICPAGLKFDSSIGSCDYPEECGKPKPKAAPASAVQNQTAYGSQSSYGSQPVQSTPPKTSSFNCGSNPDGYYFIKPCSSNYFHCSAGQSTEINCPAGLKFDPSIGSCDYPEQCGQPRPKTTPAPPQQTVQAPKVDFNCRSSPDGYYYKQPCQQSYFHCSAGQAIELNCQAGLKFDPANGSCVYANECGQKKPQVTGPAASTPAYGPQTSYGQPAQSPQVAPIQQQPQPAPVYTPPPVQARPVQQPQPAYGYGQAAPVPAPVQTSLFNCGSNQDGYYFNKPCSSVYFHCSGGQAIELKCPAGLKYDPAITACDYPEQCGQPRPKTTPAPPQQTPVQPSPPKSTFNCGSNPDGYYYIQPCQQSYFHCLAGQSTEIFCPAGLKFDPVMGACDQPEICGKPKDKLASDQPVKQPQPTQQAYGQTTGGYGRQPSYGSQSVQSTPPKTSSFNCGSNPDGYYFIKPCSSNYFHCSAGQSTEIFCPAGLKFDPLITACDYPEQCGQPRPKMTPAPPQQTTSPLKVNFNCNSTSEGYFYTQPCGSSYFHCSAGQATEIKCPAGLKFDPANGSCVYANECGQKKTAPSATTTSYGQPATVQQPQAPAPQVYGQQVAQPPIQQAQPQQQYVQQAPPQQQSPPPAPVYQKPAQVQASPPPMYPQPPVTYPQSPPVSPPVNLSFQCGDRPDGFYYKQACTPSYFTCVGGQSTELSCPALLHFNPSIGACDYPEECGKPKQVEQAVPAVPNVQSQPSGAYTGYSVVAKPQPIQPSQGFSCTGKKDGYYIKEPCSTPFYTCVKGVKTKMGCPSGLVFEPRRGFCEYPTVCGQPKTTAAPYAIEKVNPSYTAQSVAPTPPPSLPVPKPDFDCTGKIAGYYEQGHCQNKYISCSHGHAYQYSCPAQLVFSQQSQICDFEENCRNPKPQQPASAPVQQQPSASSSYRGSSPQVTPASAGTYANTGDSYNYSTPSSPVVNQYGPPPPVPAVVPQTSLNIHPVVLVYGGQAPNQQQVQKPKGKKFDCTGKKEGVYSNGGCSTVFTKCANGQDFLYQCPQGLFYNSDNNQCNHREHIVACGGTPPPVITPSPLTSTPASAPLAPVTNHNCGPTVRGSHGTAPCSANYITCWDGQATGAVCFHGQVYNFENGQCDFKTNVKGCGVSVTAPNPVAPQSAQGYGNGYAQSQPSYPAQKPIQQQQPAPTSNLCNGKDDGFYVENCNNTFFICHAGQTLVQQCPVGLYYDAEVKQCNLQDRVPACGGIRPKPKPEQVKQEPIQQMPASNPNAEFDCTGKAAGYYSKGCSSHYYSCAGSTTLKMDCPGGLKYSQEDKMCEYQTNVPECGGKLASKQQESGNQFKNGPSTSQPQQQTQPVPQASYGGQQTSTYQFPAGNRCQSLNNGIYAKPCARDYFICTDNQIQNFFCPPTDVFDANRGKCYQRDLVSGCITPSVSVGASSTY